MALVGVTCLGIVDDLSYSEFVRSGLPLGRIPESASVENRLLPRRVDGLHQVVRGLSVQRGLKKTGRR